MVNTPCTGAAVAELGQAFEGLLQDFNLSFVISNPREADNPIVWASANFFTLTGYSPAEIIGRNCRFLQGPETSHQTVMDIRDAVREDRGCSVCLLNYKKDGTPFWNALHISPIRMTEGGPVEYYVGLQADVTALHEAGGAACVAAVAADEAGQADAISRQLSEHRAEWEGRADACANFKCAADCSVPSSMLCALTKIQDCFVLSDPNLPDCPIVFASPSFLSMTGYACHEVLGRNCRFLQGPGTDEQQVQVLRDALTASPPRPVTVTLLNYRKDGTPFWNCLHVAPVRDADGRVQFFAGVQLDVTAHAPDGVAHAAAAAAEPGIEAVVADGVDIEVAIADGAGAEAVPEIAEPSPWLLLQQKGIVGAVRVATRALAQHGLRRAPAYQRTPSHAVEV